MCDVDEEIEVVASMYSRPGEFTLSETSTSVEPSFTLKLEQDGIVIKFSCHLTKDYPSSNPKVWVQEPSLKRKQQENLQRRLASFCVENQLLENPMLVELINWMKENINDFTDDLNVAQSAVTDDHTICTYIAQLHHMRSKVKYTRQLQNWSKELNISGVLAFYKRFIILVLHCEERTIKEFLSRLRSRKVDIDSSGRPCKERMLTILGQDRNVTFKRIHFDIIHAESSEEFRGYFSKNGLADVYNQYIEEVID